jgi:hypothetical protein
VLTDQVPVVAVAVDRLVVFSGLHLHLSHFSPCPTVCLPIRTVRALAVVAVAKVVREAPVVVVAKVPVGRLQYLHGEMAIMEP